MIRTTITSLSLSAKTSSRRTMFSCSKLLADSICIRHARSQSQNLKSIRMLKLKCLLRMYSLRKIIASSHLLSDVVHWYCQLSILLSIDDLSEHIFSQRYSLHCFLHTILQFVLFYNFNFSGNSYVQHSKLPVGAQYVLAPYIFTRILVQALLLEQQVLRYLHLDLHKQQRWPLLHPDAVHSSHVWACMHACSVVGQIYRLHAINPIFEREKRHSIKQKVRWPRSISEGTMESLLLSSLRTRYRPLASRNPGGISSRSIYFHPTRLLFAVQAIESRFYCLLSSIRTDEL